MRYYFSVRINGFLKEFAACAIFLLAQLAGDSPAAAQGRPISAILLQDMDFGAMVATSPSGTITLYSNGQPPAYNGILATGGVVALAVFEIRGEKFQPFTIILPSAPVLIPGGPAGNMIIDSFESSPAEGPNGTFNGQGKATVTIGATLRMTDKLPAGAYNSTFDLTVSY